MCVFPKAFREAAQNFFKCHLEGGGGCGTTNQKLFFVGKKNLLFI